jgi:signal transduction histidine kinase
MLLVTATIAVGFLWWRWRAERLQKQKASQRLQQEIEARRQAEAALRLCSSETPYLSRQELQVLYSISGLSARPGSFQDKASPVAGELARMADAEERVHQISRLATIGELAAGVVHEIKNPLTSILGYCELLMAEDLSESAKADLQMVRSEARRAADLVHNLLSFARRPGTLQTSLDLTPVLERALQLKTFDFQAGNITVARDFSKGLPRVVANESQVLQVFLNVLTNAEQAMRAAHQGGRLTIQTGSSGHRTRIDIGDNGPGIAPEHLARVFEPFFTTKGLGEGTGLGLSIAYGLIRQHGGDLWVASSPGEGSTFHIEFPVEGSPSEIAPQARPVPVTGFVSAQGG